jgi:hypothetical protein
MTSGTGFRGGDRTPTRDLRNTPGTATGGANNPEAGANWFQPNNGFAHFPREIAEVLRYRVFATFDDFREAVYRAIHANPTLRANFSAVDQAELAAGRAPFAPAGHEVGSRIKMEIDHMDEIRIMGHQTVYDMEQLLFVSPKNHLKLHSK